MADLQPFLIGLSILGSFATLFTFLLNRKKDVEANAIRQANLDNSIKTITDAITKMAEQIIAQQKILDQLKLWLELLLQQHLQNHGQEIRR